MDPFTALSLAGNVVQFVDFGIRLVSRGSELYTSATGSLTANDELELVAADLNALTAKLRSSFNSEQIECFTQEDQIFADSFERICNEAAMIAEELMGDLDKLKVKGEHRKWKSLWIALHTAWPNHQAASLERRLSRLREALDTHILVSFKYVDLHVGKDSIPRQPHFVE
jgi:hypothetical protein